jgi:hypothetical protein
MSAKQQQETESMAFYRDSKNRPNPYRMNSLTDRVRSVIAPIVADELNAGATAEEILGVIVQTAGCEVSSQAVVRATKERRAELEAQAHCAPLSNS